MELDAPAMIQEPLIVQMMAPANAGPPSPARTATIAIPTTFLRESVTSTAKVVRLAMGMGVAPQMAHVTATTGGLNLIVLTVPKIGIHWQERCLRISPVSVLAQCSVLGQRIARGMATVIWRVVVTAIHSGMG